MRIPIIMAFVASAFAFNTYAQQQQNVAECSDRAMHSEMVSTNKALEQRGFKLEQFKMMSMPSGSYVPVTVTMKEGEMYQINFLASKNFQQYHFTIIDKDRKKLSDKKIKQKEGTDHLLSESFAAPYTGNYIIVLSQKVKGQAEACGGLSILKAAGMSKK